MGKHSENSPSSFARRYECPGSRAAERGQPNNPSEYSALGTAAHWLGEQVLSRDSTKQRTNVAVYMGVVTPTVNPKTGDCFIVDQNMVDAVDMYVDYCRSLMAISNEYIVEINMPLTFLGPDETGTADFACITHGHILEVVDYKHGQGVAVDAIDNIQGLCYGLGVARKYQDAEWKELKITIVQPRAFHSHGVIRSWVISREEAEEWYMELAHASVLTEDDDAPRKAGKHCKFCKAVQCYAKDEDVAATTEIAVREAEADWVPVPVEGLSVERISYLLLNGKIDMVEDWCASFRAYAQEQHEQGNKIPLMKIVPTRAYRYFVKGTPVESLLSDTLDREKFEACHKPKELKTLAQIEKAIGKPLFAEIFDTGNPDKSKVVKLSSGTTLVSEDDKRNAVHAIGSDEFGDTTDATDDLFN